jgi:hypothetical protein
MASSVRPIPDGYHTVTPYLLVEDAAGLIPFLERAFGATVLDRYGSPDGRLAHASLQIGDSRVMMRPRLTRLTEGGSVYLIASVCVVVAAVTPAMELVPFSANLAGIVLTAFGLALIASDGLLALIAIVLTAGTIGVVAHQSLGGGSG